MNRIGLSRTEASPYEVAMSNGLTAVVITTFGLSATVLAQTETQKRLTVFVLEKDQSCVGRGTVGFELPELPWRMATFEQDKKFLVQALLAIKQEIGWQTLDYEPARNILFPTVEQLVLLINELTVEMIDREAGMEWVAAAETQDPVRTGFPICEKHQLFVSIYGCHACNDR